MPLTHPSKVTLTRDAESYLVKAYADIVLAARDVGEKHAINRPLLLISKVLDMTILDENKKISSIKRDFVGIGLIESRSVDRKFWKVLSDIPMAFQLSRGDEPEELTFLLDFIEGELIVS